MSDNIFLKDIDFYKRRIDPIKQYIEQNSFYISKMSNRPIEECKEFIINGLKNKTIHAVDPIVEHYERQDNLDKVRARCSLNTYLAKVKSNNEILVPTFTCYIDPKVKLSPLVEFIDDNKKTRSRAKKESFKAEAVGNIEQYILKNNEQNNMKIYNNSMSGAFASNGSVLYNPTAHNTLTSIIRSVSSLGNSSNEKILSGNRHYYNSDVTLSNIISITSSIDKESFKKIINKYQLKYPTYQDTIDCIKYSSDLYWRDHRAFEKIRNFVMSLSDIERAAFVYIGDFYHIRVHNDSFIRDFLTELSYKDTITKVDDPSHILKTIDEQVVNYAHQICMSETKGIGKDYSLLSDSNLHTLAATCLNIVKVIDKYRDFISEIFLTVNTPASTAYIPNMIRRSVVLSDTDSTMFSCDEWVNWYFGKIIFTDEAWAVSGGVMFITTQCIAHILALFSANMNVTKDKVFSLAMKPEFVFSAMAVTSVAKHYFTAIIVKEGNVYSKPVQEVKGVYLKNSATPKTLIDEAQSKMMEIISRVIAGEKISIVSELKNVADTERRIITSLLNGQTEFYKKTKIKSPEAYSDGPDKSPYRNHLFWREVFEPKYGTIEEPTYLVIKIPTIVDNITELKKWLASIEDLELADRLNSWLSKHTKRDLPTVYLSASYVEAFGIPKEIKGIINIKRIVTELTITNRMIIESLGYYPKTDMLISELGY